MMWYYPKPKYPFFVLVLGAVDPNAAPLPPAASL
jgi:hypothetical protein